MARAYRDPPPADEADPVAQLGALRATYASPSLRDALSGPLVVAGVLVAFSFATGWTVSYVFLPAAAWIVAVPLVRFLSDRGWTVSIHEKGLLLSRAGARPQRSLVSFDNINEVWVELARFRRQSKLFPRAVRLLDFDGAEHRAPLTSTNAGPLMGALVQAHAQPLLEEAEAALREGETLKFRSVHLEKDGIFVGGAKLHWSGLRLAALKRGKLYLYGRRPLLSWRTIRLDRFPNPTVLAYLVLSRAQGARVDDQLIAVPRGRLPIPVIDEKQEALQEMFVGGAIFAFGVSLSLYLSTLNEVRVAIAWLPVVYGIWHFWRGYTAYKAKR
jgi:hypothetical protein